MMGRGAGWIQIKVEGVRADFGRVTHSRLGEEGLLRVVNRSRWNNLLASVPTGVQIADNRVAGNVLCNYAGKIIRR